MNYVILSYLISLLCLTACTTPPDQSEMSSEEQELICQKAKRDASLFCNETSVSRTFRDATCWKAKRNIKTYCDQ